jgi:hypothetical protein
MVGLAVRTQPTGCKPARCETLSEGTLRTAAVDVIADSVGGSAPDPPSMPDHAATAAGFVMSPVPLLRLAFGVVVRFAVNDIMPGREAETVRRCALGEIADAIKEVAAGVREPAVVEEPRPELGEPPGAAETGHGPRKPAPPPDPAIDEPRRRPCPPETGGL